MNCEQVDERLLDFVEQTLDADQAEQVRAHLAHCPPCQARHRETIELVAGMARERSAAACTAANPSPPSAPSAAPRASWQPGDTLGDFEILGELGRGGMGIVYKARQRSLKRIVALKLLPAALAQSPAAVSRFRTEAQAAAKLHHTNIVAVYAQGEHEGHLFYAMELIDGDSLDHVLREDRAALFREPPPPSYIGPAPSASISSTTRAVGRSARGYRRVARLIADVADALDHAHRQRVTHRDIKPQNLILGRDGLLHITDFGLARLYDEPGVTLTGEMLGTPAYMSPEQVGADRHRIDHRTDIFSLGVTLYEVLTGRRPFEGVTREQIVARICATEPRAPRKLDPAVPADLETICLRALEKSPARRYSTAGDLAADLRRFADGMPIRSRRIGVVEKAVKWVRRHPAAATIYALMLLLLVGGSLWLRQTLLERRATANELVRRAFDLLAYDSYQETREPLALLKRAQPLGPDSAPAGLAWALARLLDDTPASIDTLDDLLAQDPSQTDAMYLLAWAAARLGRLYEVDHWVRQGDQAGGPRSAAGHFFCAQAVMRENPDRSVEECRRATALRPNYAQAMLHLARANNHWMYLYRKHDRFDELVRALESACLLQPSKAYPRYLLSLAYRLSGEIYRDDGREVDARDHFAKALDAARKAQEIQPASPRGFVAEAEWWESLGDFERALELRDRSDPLCRRPSDRIELLEYRWRLKYWTGRFHRALADLSAMTAIPDCDPDDPRYLWYASMYPALVLAEMDRPAEALDHVRMMATRRPHDVRTITSAACVLSLLGREQEARRLLASHAANIDVFCPYTPNVSPELTRLSYGFCRGDIGWDDLIRRSSAAGESRWFWAPVRFFRAVRSFTEGDRARTLAELEQCRRCFDQDDYSYLATVLLRRMEADPDWSARIRAPANVTLVEP